MVDCLSRLGGKDRALLGFFLACALLVPVFASAQTTDDWVGLNQNYLVPPKLDTGITPLAEDHAFGAQINLQNGGVEFDATDISIRGNSGLPVALSRRLIVEDRTHNPGELLGFGDWSIAIPNLHGTFINGMGWQTSASTNPNLRCSQPGAPPDLPDFAAYQYWSGYWLDVPGQGQHAMLEEPSTQLPAPSSGSYPWITKSLWRIACESSTANGYPGEGFIAISPQGIKYYFDYVVQVPTAKIVRGWSPAGSDFQNRDVVYFLVTKIEDRFGNVVTYTYSGNQLQSITSNHGRYIDLTWSGGDIVSASSNIGTWQYSYSGGALAKVTLPDGSSWSYSHTGDMTITPQNSLHLYQPIPTCMPPGVSTGAFTYQITTPSSATANFDFDVQRHGRSNVPKYCNSYLIPGGGVGSSRYSYEWLTIPNFFDTFTLTSKQVTGPGLPTATWTYSYSTVPLFFADKCNIPNSTLACPEYSTTEVSGPAGIYKQYLFGAWYGVNDGQLLEVDTGTDASNILRTVVTSYSDGVSQPFPNTVGINPFLYSDTLTSAALRPESGTVVTQDGATFTTAVNAFDVFARATSETESSSLGYSKTDTTTYADDVNRWVLGMVTSTTTNGIVASQTSYDSLDQPTSHYSFGKLIATDAWNADGTLASVTDGNGHATSLSNWYRGLPQHVGFADGTSESATVNAAGWITAITDEDGATTHYTYDAMGRLASIAYPMGDDVAWNQTLLSFTPTGSGQFGTAVGSWVHTVQTGNDVTRTFYDALWRPLITEHYDAGNAAATLSEVVDRYDADGRKVFTSYPTRSASSITQALPGSSMTYDALGRVTAVSQASGIGTLTTTTQYLAGFQTKVTDPRGNSTLTTYQAFGSPTTKYPTSVTAPNGELTVIMRDAFGKPISITRTGTAAGSLQLTRYYVYNGFQQLCKRVDPESGATAFGYDAAGNLAWSAAGLTLTGTTTCDASAALASGRVVNRTYNARNEVTAMTFPDGNGNQTWTYTPDGQPSTVTRQNDNSASVLITNTYLYDQRGLLIGEGLTDNGATWSVGYGHDANGHLASETYPNGLTVPFAPNALGQPTEVGTYATGVSYAADGKVSQFSYANGIMHSMAENVRGLIASLTDSGGGVTPLQETYTYDADGDPTAISDAANPAQDRSMAYDTLDRLVQATVAYQGTTPTTFSYDVLDNLTSISQGTHEKTLTYSPATDQLTQLIDSATGTTAFTYDVQGNLASKGGQAYAFDDANRLRWATGRESYAYDSQGRRVLATALSAGDQSIESMYSLSGQLQYQQDNRNQVSHAYLYLGGQLVATIDYPFAGGSSVRYEHSNAQGSIVAETNASRLITKASIYASWGALLNHANDDAPGYTGHLQDSLTGLTYMQQRYYDPETGRFLSVDPVAVNPNTGANFNRYAYAQDNPYRYTDPTGMCTGSHISNSDGTCASSGDFTTQASNAHLPGASASQRASILGFQPTNAQSSALSHLSYQDVAGQDSTRETKFIMDDSGKITENSQEGCYSGSECRFSPSEASKGSLYGHTHVYPSISRMNPQAKILLMTRDEPGPGDANPLSIGKVSAIFTPGGYKYLIEGTVHSPHLIYLGGGNPAFGNFVQDTWAPGMTLEKMEEVIEQQYHH